MTITPFLVVPFLTWAIAQSIKFVLALFRGDFDIRYLIASGGMPSVHSAVVCSLVVIALAEGGPNSPLFGITGVLAVIVMYDSFGVRRSAGEQAKILNQLIDDLSHDGDIRHPENYGRLREILGHRPVEVSVGAVLGVVIALLFEADKLNSHLAFLVAPATKIESIIFTILSIILIVGGIVAFIKLGKMVKNNKTAKSLRMQLLACTLSGGILLMLVILGEFQSILYLSARVLPYVLVVIWGIWLSSTIVRLANNLSIAREDKINAMRRDKWLKKAGRTKKKSNR